MLGGKPAPQPHTSFYSTESGKGNHRTVVELSTPLGVSELLPGDFVEAELELVVFPTDAAAYYGPDKAFQEALTRDADTWRLVHREAAGNALKIQARRGTVVNPYPVVMAVDVRQRAEVTLRSGLGYVPVTFTGLSKPRGYQLFLDDKRVDQNVHGNDFWQTDFDAGKQQWRMTFNVYLPTPSQAAHTLRFEPESPEGKAEQ